MPKNNNHTRRFECDGECRERYIESITLSCNNCIKNIEVKLTADQELQILNIINRKYF